jgi:hypothetical protein
MTTDTMERDQLLEQLRDAGERRATANRQTLDGLTQLKKAYEDIRVYSAEARRLHMPWPRIGAAVGVSRTQLHNIITGKTKV